MQILSTTAETTEYQTLLNLFLYLHNSTKISKFSSCLTFILVQNRGKIKQNDESLLISCGPHGGHPPLAHFGLHHVDTPIKSSLLIYSTPSYYSSIGEKGKNVSCLNLVSISISSFLFASYCLPLQTVLFSATCHRGEKAALLKVKYSWHNPGFLFSWDTAADCCNWTYIICSQVGRVIDISFPESDISTFLPPVIGELSALKSLANAFMPALTSPIPPFFTKLTGLEVLV